MTTAAPTPEVIHVGNVPLPSPAQLPDDYDLLKRMILELLATLQREPNEARVRIVRRLDPYDVAHPGMNAASEISIIAYSHDRKTVDRCRAFRGVETN